MRKGRLEKIPLSLFLHFYQPWQQQPDILERIVEESYKPILEIFANNRQARATFSFPAGLIRLLQNKGYSDVIDKLKKLVERNQIELTGTAAYHGFLPLLPVSEIKRQILLNEETLNQFFGKAHTRSGFFPPELAFSYKVAKIVTRLGFKWMAIPMISLGHKIPDYTSLFKLNGYNLYLFPRHKWASSVVLSGNVRSKKSFLNWIKNEQPRGYYLLIMDGETFGHHRPGLEELLQELCTASEFELLQVSDLFKKFTKVENVKPREASWSNEEQDFWLDREKKIIAKNPFLLWKDPKNPIHKLQWQQTALAIKVIKDFKLKIGNSNLMRWKKARDMLDKALASDQYWWASAKPWWSLEMTEAGSWQLVQVVKTATGGKSEFTKQAEILYRKILNKAFFWQRSGYIRKKHRQISGAILQPFAKRAPAEWYNQIILEFEDEMRRAAQLYEFEKAIKWRDAVHKLKTGADVFDVLHVVDELQAARKIPSLKPFLLYKEVEVSKFAKKYLQKLSKTEIVKGKENLRKQGFKV